jgi:ERCC4-type nuclease
MKIKVDIRERAIIDIIKERNSPIKCEYVPLDIGDIHICDDDDNIVLLIERKTISDLASSITDGRYKEQSYRLHHHNTHNHNIMYIIEGRITDYNERFSRVSRKALYSAMMVLQYFKGFSVFRTISKEETVDYILQITDKIQREKKKGFYSGGSESSESSESNAYPVVHMQKKNNIGKENIDCFMLCQIPGIQQSTANAILEKYPSIRSLFDTYKEDPTFLDAIRTPRRLSLKVKENIITFLLNR